MNALDNESASNCNRTIFLKSVEAIIVIILSILQSQEMQL